jgi:hypothetical protein
MVKIVFVSDIVVLYQSFVDENFWIMLVDMPLHMVTPHFIHVWG